MKISNHRLEGHWYGESPNTGGTLTNPTILVMHFTASGGTNGKGDADYFKTTAAKTSAHLVIGRDGTVYQVVGFNREAWHAGKSIWRGKTNCNDFSIGIEIDNWGKLVRTEDGKYRSWTKSEVDPSDVIKARHKDEKQDCYWELYPEAQLRALEEVTKAILATYPTITEIVGHDDISPGRKTDPGPAFPMERFRSLVQGRGNRQELYRTTTANVNLRGGPGTNYAVIRVLMKGTRVRVVYDKPGDWAQLPEGWVNDKYLA